MSSKPVVLLCDLDNVLVDECSPLIGQTGLYTTINTYNETNAIEVIRQYNRGFGLLTNRLSCVITGWNRYKKPSGCYSECERRKNAVLCEAPRP